MLSEQVVHAEGTSLKQHIAENKLLMVDFWATWCAPCVKEFPSMKRMVEAMKGEVVVLAISYDRDREDIDTFIKAFGGVPADFRIAWDKDKLTSSILGTDVLPESYIVGRDGKLIRKIVGEANWDDPMALDFFQKLVSK